MADYYLINDQIKFYFDIEYQSIEFNDNKESLEPKEAKILRYILENHQDGLIKSEKILDDNWDYWSDKKVLQKVLSTLRKKFKLIGVTENGFIATGTEYKINYRGVLINDDIQKQKVKEANKSKLLKNINSAAIWAFIGAATILFLLHNDQGPNFTVDNIIQATAISGVSNAPALSPDGKALAFTHRDEKTSKIYLKTDDNIGYHALTENFNDKTPSWSPSGNALIFQRRSADSCEIRIIKFSPDYKQLGKDEQVTTCSPSTYYMSFAWKDEENIFFTDTKNNKSAYEIMTYNFKTKTKVPYLDYETHKDTSSYQAAGHYYVYYDRQSDALFSLNSPDWISSEFNRFDDNKNRVSLFSIDETLRAFAVHDGHIIFRDIDNQLKAISINRKDKITTVYQNPLKPIFSPAVSSNSNKIAFTSGSYFRDNMYALNLKTNTVAEVITSKFRLRLPKQVNGTIYFISGETGIYQIYAFVNNQRHQITSFTKNRRISYFSVSKDQKWIAINFLDETKLYRINNQGVTAVKSFPLMSYPAFSNDNTRMLLSSFQVKEDDSTSRRLTEYSLSDLTETGLNIKNAVFGVYHELGIIYADDTKGVKIYTLNGTRLLTDEHQVKNPMFFSVNKQYAFITSAFNAFKINLETLEVSELPNVYEQITSNDTHIFYNKRKLSNMTIFKGELVEQ